MILNLLIANLIATILILLVLLLKYKNKQDHDLDNKLNLANKDLLIHLNQIQNQNNQSLLDVLNQINERQTAQAFQASEKQIQFANQSHQRIVKDLNENFVKVNDLLADKLYAISKEMNDKINKNFEKTNTSFASMIERLSKIDEAQKKIETLSTDIVSLQDVLTDKKTRGIYGEVQLSNILKSVFGEPGKFYSLQHKLSNSTLVDAFIKVPEPVGNIAIDSKFPLENYSRMVDDALDKAIKIQAAKDFRLNMKTHIDAIANKYIIENETAKSAILFLPAEAIFAYTNAYFNDVIEYAFSKHVWISSPTTLMATLTSIQVILKNIESTKYTKQIHFHLEKLKEEFNRYEDRWDKLTNDINKVSDDVKKISTTSSKITKQFNQISDLEFDRKEGNYLE